MHGPGTWFSPAYPQPIQVIDGVVGQISRGLFRRRNWRIARDQALDSWRAAGINIEVSEFPAPLFDSCKPYECWSAKTDSYYLPNVIRLLRWEPTAEGRVNFGHYEPRFNGGIVCFLFDDDKLRRYSRPELRSLITHEVGHALGLAHPPRETLVASCMGGTVNYQQKPSSHDLESIRDWYL